MEFMTYDIGEGTLEMRQARELLKKSHLFKGLPEMEIDRLASLLRVVYMEAGEKLFEQGDRGNSFYIILNGTVAITRKYGAEEELFSTMTTGDFFGEGSLLFGSPRRASVTALEAMAVLRMERDDFNDFLDSNPAIRKELVIVSQGYDIAGRKHFNWLGDDEGLHLVARKHPMILFLAEIPVIMLLFLSLGMMYFGARIPMSILLYSGITLLVITFGWGIWRYIDWSDDYYIVTDKRVVWLEETFLLYESIQEAKLTEVRSVDISTDFFQRIFGYGDLHIRTYTGNIIMRNIGQPERFKFLIEEYWHRAIEETRHDEDVDVDTRLREKLGMPLPNKQKRREPLSIEAHRIASKKRSDKLSRRIFTNIFKMRYLEGDTIVYRKHWFLLLLLIWQPTLGLLTVLIGGTYLIINFPGTVFYMFYAISLISLLAWWVYKYWDWRDDRYELTRTSITDLDRTPLGRENRQTAPLESILSLEHERIGILGIMLNFGTVAINVGDKTYEFEGVHNPAQVRQEISDRQQSRRKHLEREQIIRDEERQLEWLARYHRNARELWELPEFEEEEEDDFELQ
jgi:hypothetical protein